MSRAKRYTDIMEAASGLTAVHQARTSYHSRIGYTGSSQQGMEHPVNPKSRAAPAGIANAMSCRGGSGISRYERSAFTSRRFFTVRLSSPEIRRD